MFQAAFIAGVQSQIIPLRSKIGQSTNAIALVGLLLDVTGASLGIIHAIVLQQRIKENTDLFSAVTQINTKLRAIQNLRNTNLDKTITQDQLQEIVIDPERTQRVLEVLKDHFRRREVSEAFDIEVNILGRQFPG